MSVESSGNVELPPSGKRGSPEATAEAKGEAEAIIAAEAVPVQRGVGGTLRAAAEAGPRAAMAAAAHSAADYASKSALFYWSDKPRFWKEVIAGVIVAIMQLPESVAFSYVAGVPPLVGLHSTFILGLITALFGGKPAMISGAAGAMAVVAVILTSASGPLGHLDNGARIAHFFTTMVLCGVFQILAGVLKLGSLARLIPATAMIGFMNGLAIIIFIAQLPAFQECQGFSQFYDCAEDERTWLRADEWATWLAVAMSLASMAIMFAWPRTPRVGKLVPAPLVAITVGLAFEHLLNRPLLGSPLRTIGETAPIDGAFPAFNVPWTSLDSVEFGVMLRYGAIFAAIGLIESVMTLQAVNELTNTVPTAFAISQECVAQGVGNLTCAFFGAMGGDTMIGQSAINIRSGARGRLSGVTAAIGVLIITVAVSPLVNLIPIAVLTGVLFAVVVSTFNWNTFRILTKVSRVDAVVIITVTVLAVLTDLAVAVFIGVAISAIANSWSSARVFEVHSETRRNRADAKPYKVYTVKGSLFFASTRALVERFDVEEDPVDVYLDLRSSLIADFSAIDAVRSLARKYHEAGKHLHVIRLCERSNRRLQRHIPDSSPVVSLYSEGATHRTHGPPSPHWSNQMVPLSGLHVFDVPGTVDEDEAEEALEETEFLEVDDDFELGPAAVDVEAPEDEQADAGGAEPPAAAESGSSGAAGPGDDGVPPLEFRARGESALGDGQGGSSGGTDQPAPVEGRGDLGEREGGASDDERGEHE